MADEPSAMIERQDAPLLDIADWCISLNKKTLEKLNAAGCGASFSCVGYLDEEGKALVYVLAAGVEHGATKFLVERAAIAVTAYVEIGDPERTTPNGNPVN